MKIVTTVLKYLDRLFEFCHRSFSRYHLLDLRDRGEGHGYRGGWCDRDRLMLIACFTLLRDYVEKEDPEVGLRDAEVHAAPDDPDHEALERQRLAGQEIRDLYEWWVRGRSAEHAAVQALLDGGNWVGMEIVHHPRWEEFVRRDAELDEKDDAQLRRLVAVRGYLWT